ncbi:MAG: efflux RND transporter periplasmic adaptor subunit, partial [Halioglobus sp.]
LLVTLVTGAIYGRDVLSADDSPHVPLTVSTTTFTPGESYEREVSYLGLVTSGKKARLGFEIAGQIATLPVRQGSKVRAGDVIATLDDAALQARRRATAADLEQAQAELELAQLKSRRQEELVATGAVSREAYDETRLRARALTSRVEATVARLDTLDIELAKSRLIAPYDGVVADRYLHPGAVASPGVAVVQLLQEGNREAHIGVAAKRAVSLEPGTTYTLSLHGEAVSAELMSIRARGQQQRSSPSPRISAPLTASR